MKRYFFKSVSFFALLATFSSFSFAQEENSSNKIGDDEYIIIRKKGDKDTKISIEIKDGEVKINGKPMAEFKDENVTVRKQGDRMMFYNEGNDMMPPNPPRSPFRRGGDLYVNGNPNKAFLGVRTDDDENGAKITSVTKGSAAEKAGLKEGDVIIKIDEIIVKDPRDLTEAITAMKPESKAVIEYIRNKKEQKATATLGRRPANAMIIPPADINFNDFNLNMENFGKGRFGIKAQDTEEGKGVKVLNVEEESNAAKAGIKKGDIIEAFDEQEVNSAAELAEAARDARDKNNVKVKFSRQGKSQELEIKIPKKLKTTNL
jgi:serine protease Do